MPSDPLDQVILVNELDQELGSMDKVAAHRGTGQLHRAISVFLYNSKGELLIQQRSQHKIVGALQWANTCCGNVRPGESYEACAQRRLQEELGVTGVMLQPQQKFIYHVACNSEFSEFELDQIFVGFYEGAVHPNPLEVQDWAWIPRAELLQRLADDATQSSLKFSPWLHIMSQRQLIPTWSISPSSAQHPSSVPTLST